MNKLIDDLQKTTINTLTYINDIVFQRTRKISFTTLFYYLSQLISDSDKSSTLISSKLEIENICTASNDAYIKKRKLVPSICFEILFVDLLNFFYGFHNKLLFNIYRVLAVDGTHAPLSKELYNEQFKLTTNNTYVDALISGIYDVYNKTIIDLSLSNSKNERNIYENQFNHLKENNIIIHDRGYYSHKLLYLLNSIKVYPIFRMKTTYKFVKKFIKSDIDDKIYEIKHKDTNNEVIKLRLVKYKINNKLYILGTTLLDDNLFTINILKELYSDRWDIEIYFRTVKYYLSFKNFHSKSSELIKQEIYVHKCVTLLTRIMEEIYVDHNDVKNKYNPHNKNNIDKLLDKIIKPLLFKKKCAKKIIRCLKIIFKSLVKIRNGRTFRRICIIPPNNWYQHPEAIT